MRHLPWTESVGFRRLISRQIPVDSSEPPHLPVSTTFGHRDIDRLLVDIHPDEHAILAHDLPPCSLALHAGPVPSCNPRFARGRSPFNPFRQPY